MKKILSLIMVFVLVLGLAACTSEGGNGDVEQVSILTPYLSSVTTNQMVETMKAGMESKGWNVTVVDTKGDFGDLASRMEDTISANVDAMVLVSTDPNQVQTQIENAAAAGIPVFGCDAGFIEGMEINATSDNYAMGVQLTEFLFDALGNEGNIIALTHRPHPGVIKRSEALDDLLPDFPNINLVTEQHVEVPGPIESSRQIMENLLLSNPEVGSIDAVWAAWDEPAIGVAQALEAAGRDEIIVAGVDGNSQAIEMIKEGSAIKATVGQNFEGMAEIVVNEMASLFDGNTLEKGDKYAPATLITE